MSCPNVTVSMNTTTSMETWMDRLGIYWNRQWGILAWETLGMVLCILIAYLSIFSKRITGDYKWFVLNEVIANLLRTFCTFLFNLTVYVIMGWRQYLDYSFYQKYDGNGPPILFSLFERVFYEQLYQRIVPYVLLTTLFAIIFNRWMAIVCPQRYSVFMSRRLIIFYCISCYLIIYLFTNPLTVRLLARLPFLENTIVVLVLSAIPWLLAITLNVHACFILWKHRRTVSNSISNERMRESRDVIIASAIQLVFISVELIFTIINDVAYVLITEDAYFEISWIINHPAFTKIYTVYYGYLIFLYPCLTILFVMKPYREAILPPFFPTLKIFTRSIKTEPNTIQVIPINLALSTPFKGQQPLTGH